MSVNAAKGSNLSSAGTKDDAALKRWHSGKFHVHRERRDSEGSTFAGFNLCDGASYFGELDGERRPHGTGFYEWTENKYRALIQVSLCAVNQEIKFSSISVH